MKILGIILGILMAVGGCYCIANPAATFLSVVIVLGITLIECAIASFVSWYRLKKAGKGSALLIVNAIISLIAGITLLTNDMVKLFTADFLLSFAAFLMIFTGIQQIVRSFQVRKKISTGIFVLILIVGILTTVAGVISVSNPAALGLTIGITIGFDILMVGIRIIISSVYLGALNDTIEERKEEIKKEIKEKLDK